MKKLIASLLVLIMLFSLVACAGGNAAPATEATAPAPVEERAAPAPAKEEPTPAAAAEPAAPAEKKNGAATAATAAANAAWYDKLDFENTKEYDNAARGLIEAPESVLITREDGTAAWRVTASDYDGPVPDTVNPSLWRDTQLNAYAGLFEVCDGIYQVRGYDMANATFIQTDHGYIVFDVLMCREDMQAALKLAEAHLGKINVVAVLYSHSHVDHYGGVEGLISLEQATDASLPLEEQLASGKVPVLAPAGFLEAAVSENVYVGQTMARRAQYQYGSLLDQGPEGRLAIGIGMGQATGTRSRLQLLSALMGNGADGVKLEGNSAILQRLTKYVTAFNNAFNVIEP